MDKTGNSRYKKSASAVAASVAARTLKSFCQENTVLNEERRRHILEILNREGRVMVGDLARQFRTSQVTIRKDLDVLQAEGRIYRSHGGALPARASSALDDPTLREKEKLHRKEKLRIAAAAAAMVREGQVVILDSGTTNTAIARALRDFRKSHHHH